MAGSLTTLGYEGLTVRQFLDRLQKGRVTLLCDVRRTPISRKKGFSKGPLRRACEALDIRYEHRPEFGIASSERARARSPAARQAMFDRYQRRTLVREAAAVEEIAAWVRAGERVVLTCFEADPAQCHRRRLELTLARRVNVNSRS